MQALHEGSGPRAEEVVHVSSLASHVRVIVCLRFVCLPTQPSQPAESALSAEWHTGVCKATSVLRGTLLDI